MAGHRKHSLGAAWREARKLTSDAVSAGMSRAETANPEYVQRMKDARVKAAQRAKELGRTASRKRSELTLRFAATSMGTATGRGAAKLGSTMSTLPVLSLPSDVFNERNGINRLAERLRESPDDPFVNLVLAESISRMQRELLTLTAVRTAVTMSPVALLMRESMKTASALNRANELPLVDKLLKRAYGMAMSQLRTHPGEPASLHIISRVYLAKRNPQGCLKPALLGVCRDDTPGEAGPIFYTMSRAYQSLGDQENARSSAQAAIDDDFSLGWLTLSDLIYEDPDLATAKARHKAYLEALSHVTQEDLACYAGIDPRTKEIAKSVYALQKTKALTAYANVNQSVKRVRENVTQRISAARQVTDERKSPPSLPAGGASDG
ncbi:hypothetical protein [Streptomyces sp. NPDC056948]|uniref:hypothetical protein n=1 Tax=Streptomyces sp. NPDC056948 TaxID=3345975 RepID=UPI003626A294